MKNVLINRIFSMFLCLILCLSMFPTSAFAADADESDGADFSEAAEEPSEQLPGEEAEAAGESVREETVTSEAAYAGELSLTYGDTQTLTQYCTDTVSKVTVTSSNQNVISVLSCNCTGKASTARVKAVGAGTATVTFGSTTAAGNYCTCTWTITVSAIDISDATIKLSCSSYTYDGTAKCPDVTSVTLDGTTLSSSNYSVSYSNNTEVGTARVTVKGKGNYTGSCSKTFTISEGAYSLSVDIPETEFNVGESMQITATTDGSTAITYQSQDESIATVSGSGLVTGKSAGSTTITVTVAGDDTHVATSKKLQITIHPATAARITDVALSSAEYVYTGEECRPSVTVSSGSSVLRQGSDYTLAYENNVNAGTASVVITPLGDVYPEKTVTYTITKAEQDLTVSISEDEIPRLRTASITAEGIGTISYSSSDSTIASVSSDGTVTGKSLGTADITVKAAGDENHKSALAIISVTVVKSPYCGDDLKWSIDSDGTLSITGTGAMYDYGSSSRPEWYESRTEITALAFGPEVTSIGTYAFQGCTGLTDVTVPDNVRSIGIGAFAGCTSLVSMTLPFVGGSVKTADDTYQYPFGYIFGTSSNSACYSAQQQYYGSSVSSSGYTTTTYYIPFGLTSVTITGGNILYDAFYGCTGITKVQLPEGLTAICRNAFSGCTGLTEINFPQSLETIGIYAFYNCTGLTQVELPDSLSTIDEHAFYGCTGLAEISFPAGLKTIGTEAFYGCSGLTKVSLPAGQTDIGKNAFRECTGLTEVTIPEGVTSLTYTFQGCTGLTEVYLPDSLTSMQGVFYNCTGLQEIDLPDGLTVLGSSTFYGCISLTEIDLPSGLTGIGSWAFENCTALKTVIVPDSVTSIGSYAFRYCTGLTSVKLGKSLNTINTCAFYGCTGLTNLTIPDSVTSIGKTVLSGCSSLQSIIVPFLGASQSDSSPLGYLFDTTSYTGGTACESGTTSSTTTYYYIPSSLRKVTISRGNICEKAFYNCSMITDIHIPDTATTIGQYAFGYCTGLKNVNLPYGLKTMGTAVFFDCSKLTEIVVPNSVTSIGVCAFSGCTSLRKLTLPFVGSSPDQTNATYQYPFGAMFGLSSRTGTTAVKQTYIANNSQTTVTTYIPTSLTEVTITGGKFLRGAFQNCTMIKKITLPDNISTIYTNAFSGCSGLTDVYYAGTLNDWNNISISSGNTPLTSATLHCANAVHFDAAGGTVATESLNIINDKPYGTLPTPMRDGYYFDGWYTAAEGGTVVTEDTVFSAGKTTTLYAHWTAHISGDVDGNRSVNLSDLLTLKKALAYGDLTGISPIGADLSGDNQTTLVDLLMLRQILANT